MMGCERGGEIRIITALPAEAKPVHRHFQLQRDNRIQAYPVYRGARIVLVVCGVGGRNAAAAVRWLHDLQPTPPSCLWLNIGIAGHADLQLGEAILAESVVDTRGRRLALRPPRGICPCSPLLSVEQPLPDYTLGMMHDMEGFGFVETVQRLSPDDDCHCLKIISDNRHNPSRAISGRLVNELIGKRLDRVEELIAQWRRGDK